MLVPPYNDGGHSVTEYAKVLGVSVAIPPVGSIQGNGSSITQYPISGHLDVSQNSTVAKSIHPMMATVTPKAAIGRGENSFMELTNANQTLIDNHNTNLKTITRMATQNNDNQIPGEGKK